MPSSTTSMPHLPPLAQSGDFLNNLINRIATYFLCEGTFSRCWLSLSTPCLRVSPLDSSPQAATSGQCLLPLPHTSLSSLYCIIAQTHISYLTFESPTPPSRNINSLPAASPFPRFVITFCVSLELLQAGTSTVGFSLALITFSLVRWPSSCLFA